MNRNRPYGKAFRITREEADAYVRVNRPRGYVPNPLGVTAMATVNGRGAHARSVRSLSKGKTQAERAARARLVMRNGENEMSRRAAFLKNPLQSRHYRGYTSKASPAARARRAEEVAAKPAKASKTRKRNKKASAAKPLSAATVARRNKLRGKRLAAYSAAKRSGKPEAVAAKAAVRAVPLAKGETFKGIAGKGKRKAVKQKTQVGKTYTRVRLVDPSTGKKKLSWMHKTKKGLRRIPASAILSTKTMSASALQKRREAAAARILKSGSVFVANKAKAKTKGKKMGTAKQKRGGKRLAAFMAAKRSGKSVADATKAALRAVPLKSGETFKGHTAGGSVKKATKKTTKKTAKKATKKTTKKTAKKASRKSTKKRQSASKAKRRSITYEWIKGATVAPVRRLKAKKAAKKSTKKASKKPAKRTSKKAGKRTAAQRSASAKKAARTRKRNAKMKPNRRAHAGYASPHVRRGAPVVRVKRNGRRRRGMRRNGFMAQLTSVLKTGLFVAGGFLSHKLLTNLAIEYGVNKLPIPALQNSVLFQQWKKPLVGLGVLAVGIPLTQKLLKRNSTEVAAGMAASLFQSVIVTALSKQPTWQNRLSGYSNSRAYSLRGAMERNAQSIAPRYAAVRGFQQAAAGFQQAAAGTGEYFSANGVGEYFAASGLQGVGSYEAAGQLALQAAAGADEIDDGIRPDSDIDGLLDLAEAAAGLRGTGEFYTAVKESGGRVVAKKVGEQSQWVPAGPLWAGASFVDDTQDTSELPAGILSADGGNGSLSA